MLAGDTHALNDKVRMRAPRAGDSAPGRVARGGPSREEPTSLGSPLAPLRLGDTPLPGWGYTRHTLT